VHLANEAGGTDNITALLVRIDGLVIDDEPDVVTDGNLRLNTAELEALAAEGMPSALETKLCPQCGAEVTIDNVFCTECGAAMSGL
jgi:ribosomal protein S27AE